MPVKRKTTDVALKNVIDFCATLLVEYAQNRGSQSGNPRLLLATVERSRQSGDPRPGDQAHNTHTYTELSSFIL